MPPRLSEIASQAITTGSWVFYAPSSRLYDYPLFLTEA